MQVLRYLGRYTHRVAISNHRLLAFDQERVTFRWKDYAHGGKPGKMTLARHRVLTPLLSARAPQRLRAHPSLRVPRQSLSRFPLGTIPTTAVQWLLHAGRGWNLQSSGGEFFCLALPTLRRGDDRGSEIYRCGIINMHLLRFFVALSTTGDPEDVLPHADALVCPPLRHRLSQHSPHTLLPHLQRHSDNPHAAFPPRFAALPKLRSDPRCRSNPIAHRVRRKRQRLPPSLLIENASDRDPRSAPQLPARGVSDQG